MIGLFWLILGSAAAVAGVGLLCLTIFAIRHWKRSAASIAEQRRRIRATRVGG